MVEFFKNVVYVYSSTWLTWLTWLTFGAILRKKDWIMGKSVMYYLKYPEAWK